MGEDEGFVYLLRKLAGIILPPALIAMSGSAVRFLQKAHYAQQLQRKWTLQKAVDAATTGADVEAITWQS